MFKERQYVLGKISIIFQVILSLACFTFVWWLSVSPSEVQIESINELRNPLIIIAVIWLFLFAIGLGNIFSPISDVRLYVSYFILISLGLTSLLAINTMLSYSTLKMESLLLFGIFNLVVLIAYKKSFFAIMHFLGRRGNNIKQILIISDEGSYGEIEKIINTKDWRYNIRGIMTNCRNTESKYSNQFTVIPENARFEKVLNDERIDEVIYCKSDNNQGEIANYIANCAEVGISFRHYTGTISEEIGRKTGIPDFSLIDQLPLITYRNTPDNYVALKMKHAFDFFFSLLVIIMVSPIILIIAIIVKVQDGGPIFFKQERVGLNGRHFSCFKFRTMVANAEVLRASLLGLNEQDGPVFKIKMDPRVTKIGRFLRKTSLDELPQFFNVLRGEMSVVGPRPPIPSEVKMYQRWQKRRLSMKPGITCIWQVSGRNSISFEDWMKLDMEYIDNWSLSRDIILILKTVKVILKANGS